MADVEMPDGTVIYGVPDGVTKADLLTRLKRNGYDTARLLTPRQEENLLEQVPLVGGTLAGIADIPLSAAQGLAGTSKTFTDLFGANNRASEFLGDVTRLAGELKSSGSREDAATAAIIQKEAEDKGIWEQVKAAAKSFALSPIETTASVAGSAVPFALAAMTGGGLPAAAALGAASGVGMIKGDIYDAVQEELLKTGKVTPEQAAAVAEKAQEYGGENTDMQLLGGALGALAAATGLAPAVANRIGARAAARVASQAAARQVAGKAAPGVFRSTVTGAGAEALPEGVQAGQERYAQNLALQREGFDVDPMKGVAGQAAFEAIASLIPGAAGKVYETGPERRSAELKAGLQRGAQKLNTTILSSDTTPEEKDAAVAARAKELEDFAFDEKTAFELATEERRRAEATKDAKTASKTEAAAATPVDEIPEPTVRGKKGAKKTQATGVAGGASGPDVADVGAAGASVPPAGDAATAGEDAQTVSQAEPVGVAGVGEPVGGATGAEAGADGTLTPPTGTPSYVVDNARATVDVLRQRNPAVLDTITDLHAQDKTAAEIATATKLDVDTVRDVRIGLGLPSQGKPSGGKTIFIPGDAEERAVFEAWRDNYNSGKMAATVSTPEPMTVQSYVDRYIAGEGRDSLEMQQFAANFAPEIEAEFQKRLNKPAPTQAAATEESVADTTASDTQAEQDVSSEAEGATPQSEVDALQKFVDENNPGYKVRFDPELKGNRKWIFSLPGGKILGRSTSASGLRKQILKQPKVGPRETVNGVEVVRYPAVKPKAVKTPDKIFSRDAVDPEDIAGKLNEAQQEQVDLLVNEIDTARKARDINDAERTELVRMLEDTREVVSTATNRPEVTTGRNEAEQRKKYTELLKDPKLDAKTRENYRRELEKLNLPKSDFVWSIINSTQGKLDTLRKAGRRLRGRQDAVGKDLFEKGAKLTSEEQALKDEIKANAAEMKNQAGILLKQKRVIYDRARKRMAEMKADRTKKLNALRADFKAGRITEQKYRALMGQLRPDMIMYRKGRGAPNGISLEEMNTVVRAITSRWKANVNVKMVQSVDDLPPAIRSQLEQDDRLDAFGFLQGDDVYLIADNMNSVEDVAPTLFHEVLGHVGLRRAFREGLDDVLTDIYNTNQQVREATDRWMAENEGLYSGDEDPLARAVEEVLAEASEDGPIAAGKIDRLVRFLRNAIRKIFGTDLAISDREVRVILAMAHEQALGGDSNAVGSDSIVYASSQETQEEKKAAVKVLTEEEEVQRAQEKVATTADQIDTKNFNSVSAAITEGLKLKDAKYWLGLLRPKTFSSRFIALGGLNALDTNDMIEYAATLLGNNHPAVTGLQAALDAVDRLNGTRVAMRNKLKVTVEDLRDYIQLTGGVSSYKNTHPLTFAIDLANIYNVNMGAIKPGMSVEDVFKTDGVWQRYTELLKDPNLEDKERKDYEAKLGKRVVELKAATEAWTALGKLEGGHQMYIRIRNMHANMYRSRRLLMLKYLEDLKDSGTSEATIARLMVSFKEQEEKVNDRVTIPGSDDAHTDYPEVPLGIFHREYFPKRRFGDYWLRIKKTKFGEPVLRFYDSPAERDADLEAVSKEQGQNKEDNAYFDFGDDATNQLTDFDVFNNNTAFQRALDSIARIDPENFTEQTKKRLQSDVYQLYLLSSPEGSLRKQFIKSKNRLGWSSDIVRTVAETAEEYATDIARLRHRNEIDTALLGVKKLYDAKSQGGEPNSKRALIREFTTNMEQRIAGNEQPVTKSWANRIVPWANQLAYISFLTSAATAMVQVTAIPLRVAPYLWGRYGMANTTKALARYMNVFNAMPKLESRERGIRKTFRVATLRESNIVKNSPRHRDALERAEKEYGIIAPMSTFSLRGERTPATAVGGKLSRGFDAFYDAMTYMLDTTDQLTKEASFMAAYDLEYDRLAGEKDLTPEKRQERAILRAKKAIADTVGNFNSIYRPPIMKGSELAKALFLFKYYSVITTAFFFRATRAIARGIAAGNSPDKKQQRADAVMYTKELTGTLGAGFMFAGLTGTPLYSIGMLALQVLQDATDDDEDRRERMRQNPMTADSVEAQFRYEWLPKHFGSPTVTGADGRQHSLTDIALNGPASELSGWNVGSRVSLDLLGLWFRAPRDADTWVGTVNNMLVENIPGASASLNMVAMGEEFSKGNITDALKVGLPAQFKSAVKAYDFATEGVRTKTEKIKLRAEDITNSDIIGTTLGYNPTEVAKVQRRGRDFNNRIKELGDAKSELLGAYKSALRRIRNGDADGYELANKAADDIRKFNSKIGNKDFAITMENIVNSARGSLSEEKYDIEGMGLNEVESYYVQKAMGPQ